MQVAVTPMVYKQLLALSLEKSVLSMNLLSLIFALFKRISVLTVV